MKQIKIILIAGAVLSNIDLFSLEENGSKTWNVPEDLADFKKVAIDTVNWTAGQFIRDSLGSDIQLNTANSKGIVLLAKILKENEVKTGTLNDLEKSAFEKMVALADKEYAESEILNKSLEIIDEIIANSTEKIMTIMNATSHDDIVDILNA